MQAAENMHLGARMDAALKNSMIALIMLRTGVGYARAYAAWIVVQDRWADYEYQGKSQYPEDADALNTILEQAVEEVERVS